MLDYHGGTIEEYLWQERDVFKNFDPANPIFVGGFNQLRPARNFPRGTYVFEACEEAVFMLGWEEYADIVRMGAYGTFSGRTNYGMQQNVSFPNIIHK